MPAWGYVLTILALVIGLALGAVAFGAVWLFCQGNGLVERKPWEGD